MKNNFLKEGDVVKVLKTDNVLSWCKGKQVIGKIYKLKKGEIDTKHYYLNNNKWCINFEREDLKLLCREDKNCKLCKYRLKCITEGE